MEELIARKAEMLRSLQTAEPSGYTPGSCPTGSTAPNPSTSTATFVMPSFPKTTMATPNTALAQTMMTPGIPSSMGLTGPAPAPPMPAPCPPGTSPEQYEAYRQQCWRQYFEWCSVWQKYHTQQNDPKATQAKSKGKGNNISALASPLIHGNVGPNVAQVGGVPPPPLNGQFAAAASLAAQAANLGRGRGSLLSALDARGRGSAMMVSPTPPNGNIPGITKQTHAMLAGRGRGVNGSGIQGQASGVQQPVRMQVEEDIHTKLLGL